MFYIIGFVDYSDTKRQISLIFINIIIYLMLYFKLKKLMTDFLIFIFYFYFLLFSVIGYGIFF